jgi:hypothetical protein
MTATGLHHHIVIKDAGTGAVISPMEATAASNEQISVRFCAGLDAKTGKGRHFLALARFMPLFWLYFHCRFHKLDAGA